MSDARNKLTKLTYHYTTTTMQATHAYMYVLFFSRPRSEGSPHHGRTFSVYLCPLSFRLTLPRGSSIHVLMLSIQAGRGLPRLRAPGIVPCIISFARQLPCLRYDTRCYFNVRSKADMSQLNLPHGAQSTGHGVAIVC